MTSLAKGTTRPTLAVFFDRDGTLIEDRGHLRRGSEVVFFPETMRALRRLQDRFLLFIVTNQPGVAEGAVSLEDVKRVNDHVVGRLTEAGVDITDVYVCPHRRPDGCRCIKPNPHFLRKAAREYRVDLGHSYVVGDHPHDVELAQRVGGRGIYVLTGHGAKHLAAVPENTVIVPGILDAAIWIMRASSNQGGRPGPFGRPQPVRARQAMGFRSLRSGRVSDE